MASSRDGNGEGSVVRSEVVRLVVLLVQLVISMLAGLDFETPAPFLRSGLPFHCVSRDCLSLFRMRSSCTGVPESPAALALL